MRWRFWHRETLPDLAVDVTADVGAAPLDVGGPVSPQVDGYSDERASYADEPGVHRLAETVRSGERGSLPPEAPLPD
jgi:hypothetical protein